MSAEEHSASRRAEVLEREAPHLIAPELPVIELAGKTFDGGVIDGHLHVPAAGLHVARSEDGLVVTWVDRNGLTIVVPWHSVGRLWSAS